MLAEAEEREALTEAEKREKRLEEGIGVPHLVIDAATDKQPAQTALQWDKLPSAEEVTLQSRTASNWWPIHTRRGKG